MKYYRLSKEQLDELHPEFINFLATQSITAKEWSFIKKEKPQLAEQEIDVFSDLVWEGVLRRVEYLENISSNHLHLFKINAQDIDLIAIKSNNKHDFTTKKGFDWLRKNLHSETVEIMTANKAYSSDKQQDIFKLIKQGAHITKGQLYQWFENLIAQ